MDELEIYIEKQRNGQWRWRSESGTSTSPSDGGWVEPEKSPVWYQTADEAKEAAEARFKGQGLKLVFKSD